jgi:hypothetical protein
MHEKPAFKKLPPHRSEAARPSESYIGRITYE